MLSAILGLFGVLPSILNTVDGVTKAISDERIKKIQAQTDQERIDADTRITQLEARRDVLMSQTHNKWSSFFNACTAFLLSLPAIAYLNKVITWDKVWGSIHGCADIAHKLPTAYCTQNFRTDMLDVNMWWVVLAPVGFYFLTQRK